nr:hypothetical protein [uncultured Pseudomonas sp.]
MDAAQEAQSHQQGRILDRTPGSRADYGYRYSVCKSPAPAGFSFSARYYAPGAQLLLIQWVTDSANVELGGSDQLGRIAHYPLAQLNLDIAAMSAFPVIIWRFSD